MKALVTYAVEAEFAPWRELRNLEKLSVSDVPLHRIQAGRATVDLVITGMGAANAYRVFEAILSDDYSFCIISGFAGALKPSLQVGDVIAPQTVRQIGNGKTEMSAENLTSCALSHGAKTIDTLLSADHLIHTAAEKNALSALAEAVDMESFAILSLARARNIPAAVIRVISDSFDRDLPEDVDTLVDAAGHVKIGSVVRYLARHPLKVPALVRLGRESKTAAETLANFLEGYLKKLSFSTHGWPPPELQHVAAS
jgi:adenosylhomocysteine nucleosidase